MERCRLLAIVVFFVAIGCREAFVAEEGDAPPLNTSSARTAEIPGALSFDGIAGRAEVPHDPSMNATSGLSIAAWVYFDEYVEWASVVTKGDEIDANNYTLHQSGWCCGGAEQAGEPGHMRFTGLNVPPFVWDSKTQIPLGEWHHVGVTYDGHTLRFYLNDNPDGSYLVSEQSIALTPNETPLHIGFDPPGDDEYWSGRLDEIRIWSHALDGKFIRAAMNGHASPRADVLVGYWRFDERTGTDLIDRSRENNNGILVGATRIAPGAPIGATG